MLLSLINKKLKCLLIIISIMGPGCVTQSPYHSSNPVDQALKVCGLGYSSETAMLYRGAYQMTNKQASVEFETKFSQNLETQMTSMFKSFKPSDGSSMNIVSEQINESRDCVLSQIKSYRESSRIDLVPQCITDFKKRVGDTGNGYPYVRDWTVLESDPRNSKNNLVVGFIFS